MLKYVKFLSVIFFSIILIWTCERKTNPALPNSPPNTTLANIPKENDTLFALLTLHWDGEDYDGFISAYQYRYVTYHLFMGDSVVQEWETTQETSVTIPFESSDELNYQRFEVRAVDDLGEIDPEPAQRTFYTVQTVFPETEILIPEDEEQFFVIDHVTDWWQGVPLTFQATDADGEVVEYAWRVDDGEWNWTEDTTLTIEPQYFDPLDGPHIISVISRDNTNLIDPVGDSITVNLVQPSFTKDILIVDETDESLFSSFPALQSDTLVDGFYARVFGNNDEWDFRANGMPPKDVLGEYRLIIWHADNPYSNPTNVHKLPQHIEDVKDYLNVGGNLIMGGWRILKSFAQAEPFPKSFEPGTFIHDYLHIKQADETNAYDFVGCNPFSSVTDTFYVDKNKVNVFPFYGKLDKINIMPQRAGFTEVMYVYANYITDLPFWRGEPVGIRYYGTSFNTIVLGFPLFLIREDDAKIMANDMLRSLGF
ncbi:MAG: hypothetical protein EH225_05605 [Calditrichaeota bacterium]|nr:hypothetical protein [Calditrichota bacterium]RQW04648.1 MAG: hypothetical protein EH225_05605 [Calditrichota bacterium]